MQLATVPAGAVAVVQHYAMLRKRGAAARGALRAAHGATLEAPPCVVAVVSLGKRRARARS
jgi:ABC-type transporter Mla maintaining outer membrane lipid asymmetry permease subunit MlaE